MPSSAIQNPNLFPLGVLGKALYDFTPPSEPFDPRGQWTNTYRILTLAAIGEVLHPFQVGRLAIERAPSAAGGAHLTIHSQRVQLPFTKSNRPYAEAAASEYRQEIAAEMECAGDALATPIRWKIKIESLAPDGQPLKKLGMEKSGAIKGGARKGGMMEIATGGSIRRAPLAGPAAHAWALFDAVQRLPCAAAPPLNFTLMDHLGRIKRNHSLVFRAAVEFKMGAGRPARLYRYDELGEGSVPVVYFTSGSGRLLFAVSGIEGYILETARA